MLLISHTPAYAVKIADSRNGHLYFGMTIFSIYIDAAKNGPARLGHDHTPNPLTVSNCLLPLSSTPSESTILPHYL
jgi:hypothetical protein